MLLSDPPDIKPLSKKAVDRYYEMWKVLTPLMKRTWCSFFCTGHSSLLNSIGHQLYRDIGIFSTDGKTEQVLIPNFQTSRICLKESLFCWILIYSDIIILLSLSKIRFKSPEAKEALAQYIYERTLGIPRLVYYAILYLEYLWYLYINICYVCVSIFDYLIEYFGEKICGHKDVTAHILGHRFIDFGKTKGGGKEFDPLLSLPPELHKFCILPLSTPFFFFFFLFLHFLFFFFFFLLLFLFSTFCFIGLFF